MAIQRIVFCLGSVVFLLSILIEHLIYWKETISSKLKCQNNKTFCEEEKKITIRFFTVIFFVCLVVLFAFIHIPTNKSASSGKMNGSFI